MIDSESMRFSHASSLNFHRLPHRAGMRLETLQWLPASQDRVFEFFADALRLEAITPPWLHFTVRTPVPLAMAVGTQIDYRLRLHGVPLGWTSLISRWEPPLRFVDEQLHGPYRHWRHEHTFETCAGGTLCRDRVDYRVPGGWLVERLLVRRDLERIFTYRRNRLAEFFPYQDNPPSSQRSGADCAPRA